LYLANVERGKEIEQVKRILGLLNQMGVGMTLGKVDW